MKPFHIWLILFFSVSLVSNGVALGRDVPEKLPVYTDSINDYTATLTPPVKSRLQGLAASLAEKTGAQLAVAIVRSTQPFPIETYAVHLFDKWGIGQKGKDNGVLLLVAHEDRQVRIEVGYGLEGAIPDALAKTVISQYILPPFREGNYDKGVQDGVVALIHLIAKEYGVDPVSITNLPPITPLREENAPLANLIQAFLLLIFFFFIMTSRTGHGWFLFPPSLGGTPYSRGGYWSGSGSGGFGGGFGGFGGGGSGGGGASGRW